MMGKKYGLDQVSVRLVKEPPLFSENVIENPEDAVRILGKAFRDYDREVVGVVHLRSDHASINMVIISMGCLNQSLMHPREILKAAFLSNAESILIFHNHPSGRLLPSREDITVTARMQQLCMLAGIPILDHIILGREHQYYSFREKGILSMNDLPYSANLEEVDLKKAEQCAEKYGYKGQTTEKRSLKASLAENKKIISKNNHTREKRLKQQITLE